MQQPIGPINSVKPEPIGGMAEHPYLFFPDGNMILKATNPEQLFKIHGYLFERESDESRALFAQLNDEPVGMIELVGVESAELEDFIKVLYTPFLQEPPIKSRSEWGNVLKLSTLWNFAHFRAHAISQLHRLTTTAQRLVVALRYNVEEWLRESLLFVCEHIDLPSDRSIQRMGYEAFVKIVRVREKFAQQKSPPSRREEIHIIEEILGLPHAPHVDESSQELPLEMRADEADKPPPRSVKSKKRSRHVSDAATQTDDVPLSRPSRLTPTEPRAHGEKRKRKAKVVTVDTPNQHVEDVDHSLREQEIQGESARTGQGSRQPSSRTARSKYWSRRRRDRARRSTYGNGGTNSPTPVPCANGALGCASS